MLMYQQAEISKENFFKKINYLFASWKSLLKRAGSGSRVGPGSVIPIQGSGSVSKYPEHWSFSCRLAVARLLAERPHYLTVQPQLYAHCAASVLAVKPSLLANCSRCCTTSPSHFPASACYNCQSLVLTIKPLLAGSSDRRPASSARCTASSARSIAHFTVSSAWCPASPTLCPASSSLKPATSVQYTASTVCCLT
jgi:hypothetical protein